MPNEIETIRKYFDYNAIPDKPTRKFVKEREAWILAADKAAVVSFVNIGKWLTETKDRLPHGQFMDWVENNCRYSHQTAWRFMRVYKAFPNLTSSLNLTCSLEAIFRLSAPSVDEEIRASALEQIQAGTLSTAPQATAFIEAAKAPANAQNGQLNGHAPEYFEDAEADEELPDDDEEDGITAEEISEGYTVPAVQQPKAQRSDPAPVTAAAIDEDDLTDEEYLLRCPAYRRLMQFPHKGREFKANALAYRAMSESIPGKPTLLGQVKHAVSRSFEVAATGPFYGLAVRFANTKPPQEWPLCVKCQGKLVVFADTGDHTGHGPEIVCKGCTGGYTL